MNIIRPTVILDSIFQSSNIPETDYPEWTSESTYSDGDTVIVTQTQSISTITPATPTVFENANSSYISTAMLTSTKAIVVYNDVGNSYYGTACILDISGSTITPGIPAVFESADTEYISVAMLTSTKAIVAYKDVGNSSYGTACILDISGSTITPATPAVFESADSIFISVAMLTSTKAIVTYSDIGNSSYGTACILDISGSTITPATPAVFESAATINISNVAILTSTKAIVAYSDAGNSYYGTACILDVSTSTITPATPAVFESANSSYISTAMLTSTKAIVTYSDAGNSYYGTACILDISGSTITPGIPAVFESAVSRDISVAMLITTKAIVVYNDVGNSYYGTACILNVSTSTITPATPTVFESAYSDTISVAMLMTTKAIVAYRDVGNSYYGTACILDISGSIAAVHKIYESLQVGNSGKYPPSYTGGVTPWWLGIGATNRWKVFDTKVQSQASQATSLNWVLNPGLIDSIALLNIDATSTQIVMADQNTDLVTNGTAWTGATGTTPPTGWDKVGTPSDFTIDSGALKITVDAANEGISQTIAVTAADVMQLLGIYRNTAGDIAQYAVYDVTHSADILATTDLVSSTVNSTLSYVFTVPAGCISVKISLMAKANGDIVWFDTVSLSDVIYNKTTASPGTDLVATDLSSIITNSITIIMTYTAGTAKCGEIILGLKYDIGKMRYSPSIGIIDYSIKAVDAFGDMSITERAYSKRMSIDLLIANTVVNYVFQQLVTYRATPIVYIGSENYSSLIIYGFYKSFEIVIPYPNYSECSLEIEGLT